MAEAISPLGQCIFPYLNHAVLKGYSTGEVGYLCFMPTLNDQKLTTYFSSREWPDTYYKVSTFTFTDSLQRYVKTNLVLLRYDNYTAREALIRLKQELEFRANENKAK